MDTDDSTPAELNAHWGGYNPEFPIVTGCGSVFSAWGTGYIPHTTVLDTDGIVRGNWVGFSAGLVPQIQAVIEEYLHPPVLALHEAAVSWDEDGDGVAEPGESVEFSVTLENVGDESLETISAILSSPLPEVTVTGNQAAFPALEPGSWATGEPPFALEISADCPPILEAELTLTISYDDSMMTLPVIFSVGQRQLYFQDNLEQGSGDWSHQAAPGWNDAWHLTQEDASSPLHSWKCGDEGGGDYPAHLDALLETPELLLQPYSRLRITHRMDAEVSGAFPDSAYDGGVVEVAVSDGPWELLEAVENGYNKHFRWECGSGNPATHPFPGGTPCFSGEFDWRVSVFDLSAFAGSPVRFRFRFGSDNGGGGAGWFVDDVELWGYVSGDAVPPRLPLPEKVELRPPCPNPFNPETRLTFRLREAAVVELSIYDLRGRLVWALSPEYLAPGEYQRCFAPENSPSGLYLLTLTLDGRPAAREKLLLVK